jgi:hypothetical protein
MHQDWYFLDSARDCARMSRVQHEAEGERGTGERPGGAGRRGPRRTAAGGARQQRGAAAPEEPGATGEKRGIPQVVSITRSSLPRASSVRGQWRDAEAGAAEHRRGGTKRAAANSGGRGASTEWGRRLKNGGDRGEARNPASSIDHASPSSLPCAAAHRVAQGQWTDAEGGAGRRGLRRAAAGEAGATVPRQGAGGA